MQDPAGAICILGAACGRACRGDASLFSVADIPVYLLRLDISVDANETEM